jgi:predicted NUDIX family phosphoesterase
MSLQTSSTRSISPVANDERILVVPRVHLFPETAWHGIKEVDFSAYLHIIQTHKKFLWRSQMEEDIHYKQIIPYIVFQCDDRYFLMQRRADASAKALQNKLSLGIGGHIRQEDMNGNDCLFAWAEREFHEEVSYAGSLTKIESLGIINDDTNLIGQVHLGFALLLIGDSSHISIKTEHKQGSLVTLQECVAHYHHMESWSQMIVDVLVSKSQRSL